MLELKYNIFGFIYLFYFTLFYLLLLLLALFFLKKLQSGQFEDENGLLCS